MAIGDITAGYMGYATIGNQKVRCTDFNVNARQEPLFYDHIVGLRDSIPASLYDVKKDVGALNIQKRIWRPSVKIYQGAITYPLTSLNGSPLFSHAKLGDDFSLDFDYNCDLGRSYTYCKVNTYTFSATAGDLCQISADIMATTGNDTGGGTAYTNTEKLVTWDNLNVSVSGGSSDAIQSITFTVNNSCKPIYTAGGNNALDLNPILLRVGMQLVTGSISYYNKGADLDFLEGVTGATTINLSADGFSAMLRVVFKPQERTGAIGPVISNLPFVGVDYALGS